MFRSLIFVTLLTLGTKALACSCVGYDLEEAFDNHDVVFIGTVKKFGKPPFWQRWASRGYPKMKAVLSVSNNFKGAPDKTIVIYTNNGSAACGVPFIEGVEYAVFATQDEFGEYKGKLAASACNPTIHTKPREKYYEPERKRVLEFLSEK